MSSILIVRVGEAYSNKKAYSKLRIIDEEEAMHYLGAIDEPNLLLCQESSSATN